MARYRSDFSSKRAVLLGCNDAEMASQTRYTLQRNTSNVIIRLGVASSTMDLTAQPHVVTRFWASFHLQTSKGRVTLINQGKFVLHFKRVTMLKLLYVLKSNDIKSNIYDVSKMSHWRMKIYRRRTTSFVNSSCWNLLSLTNKMFILFLKLSEGFACEMVALNTSVKYCSENWYIGSISPSDDTTKNITDPRIATGRYLESKVVTLEVTLARCVEMGLSNSLHIGVISLIFAFMTTESPWLRN